MAEFTAMCCGECGIEYQVPEPFYRERKNNGGGWHCPNGHVRQFRESDVEKLRRERDRLQQQIARAEQEAAADRVRAERAELAAKRLKKRAAAGTCPCCQRTFANMAAHMKHQHPDFVGDTGAKVVPIKRVALANQ